MPDAPWKLQWLYECAFSRCTTTVRVTDSEWENGRNWVWRMFVLPTYDDQEMAWESYLLVHCGNSHRWPKQQFLDHCDAVKGTWAELSECDPTDPHVRVSIDGRTRHEQWSPASIKTRTSATMKKSRRKATREYKRRYEERLADKAVALNANAFGSSQKQDAYRAILLKDGVTLAPTVNGGYVREGLSRKVTRMFYGTAAAVPRPAATLKLNFAPAYRPYDWIIEDGDSYTTTQMDPGKQVRVS
jgi:hypothetical protein